MNNEGPAEPWPLCDSCRRPRWLHLLCGIPLTGKTAAARQTKWPIVSIDAIRLAMLGLPIDDLIMETCSWATPSTMDAVETYVWKTAETMITSLFLSGAEHVIFNASSIKVSARARHKKLAPWFVRCTAVVFEHDLGVIEAIARQKSILHMMPLIERMAAESEPVTESEGFAILTPKALVDSAHVYAYATHAPVWRSSPGSPGQDRH